jgi:hypothetical protein
VVLETRCRSGAGIRVVASPITNDPRERFLIGLGWAGRLNLCQGRCHCSASDCATLIWINLNPYPYAILAGDAPLKGGRLYGFFVAWHDRD